MTKTIEATLRKPVLKEDVITSHIANTYFYQKTRPKSRRKKTVIPLKKISSICLAAAILISLIMAVIVASSFVYAKYLDSLKIKFANSAKFNLVEGGAVNREIVKSFEFRGYAKNDSSRAVKNFIIVNNPKKYSWAAAAINFRFPADLHGRNLNITFRGNTGGEKINIILRDTHHKSVRLNDLYLSSSWQEAVVSLAGIKKYIDLYNIDQMRIEPGYVGESNKPDSLINFKIYVRDIMITKETAS